VWWETVHVVGGREMGGHVVAGRVIGRVVGGRAVAKCVVVLLVSIGIHTEAK